MWDVPIENNEMDMIEDPEPVEQNEDVDKMEDSEPAQDETTASTPKRKREKRPKVQCTCDVQGAACFGQRFGDTEYLQKHKKNKHDDIAAAKEKAKHANDLQAKNRNKRRDEDPAFVAMERASNAKNYKKKKAARNA
ncbi:hypothetical protein T484DRAFT_1747626 [Baffinella frigidus]|nr:hypothetical protein T484DRAFT_1747626 [Cryptophyta sp. CCMP2293]